jgi:hypothetical protein
MAKALPPQDFEETPLSADDLHWRNGFDSRFLRHTALNGRPMVVTIVAIGNLKSTRVIKKQGAEPETQTKAQRLITLAEFEKKWATNITNCEIIETLYGADMHNWIGKRITLYPTKTRGPTGGMVDCMRVRDEVPPPPAQEKREAPPKAAKEPLEERTQELLKLMGLAGTVAELDDIEAGCATESFLARDTKVLDAAFTKRRAQLMGQVAT